MSGRPAHGPDGVVVVVGEPQPGSGGPLETERGRLVVTSVAVGLVALLLGWVLGRSGDDGAAQTVDATAPTTANATATTAVPETVLPGEPVPEARLPTTTRPPRTTTTALPPVWQESTVAIDPRLAGATDRIVAVTVDRDLIELDLATGMLRTLNVRTWSTSQTPFAPIAGDDFVSVQFDNGNTPDVFIGDDTTPTRLPLSDPWATYWDVAAGTVWTMRYEDRSGRPSQMVELDLHGDATGRTIDLNGLWPSGVSDPAGGVVIGDPSVGLFSVTPEGSQRIADGRPLALGLGHVVSYECGDTLDDCGLRLIDRETGASRPVQLDEEIMTDRVLNGWWGGPQAATGVTADGRTATFALADELGRPSLGVLDTGTGELTTFESEMARFSYPSAAWSGDEHWLFLVADGVVTAYDRTTGEQFAVSVGLPETASLTVRIGS